MQSVELEALVISEIEELKAKDIVSLNVSNVTSLTDYMIVCTGTSSRHVKSIADSVVQKAKQAKVRPLGVEGLQQGEWALVDLGDVVLHVMQTETRDFYQIEKLWDVAQHAKEAT